MKSCYLDSVSPLINCPVQRLYWQFLIPCVNVFYKYDYSQCINIINIPQAGADLEEKDYRGWSALFYATYSGHQNMVKFLLKNGADPQVR